MTDAKQERCDRADIVVARMASWIPEHKRGELASHIRIALDTEVEAGGPYLNNGWNKSAQDDVRRLVDEQAQDEALWFQAQTCGEAYVQTALRKLHAAVEGDKSVILPARA